MILNNNDGENHLNNINLHKKNVKIIYRNINKENIKDNNKYEFNNRISLAKNINNISDNDNSTNNIKDINNLKGINKALSLSPSKVNKKKLQNVISQPELISMHNIQNMENPIENPKTPKSNKNNFDETFKTSLYKTNSLNNNNLNNSNISEITNNSNKKIDINSKELKNTFLEPEYLSIFNSNIPSKKKMKIKDYANFKTFKIEESFSSDLLNLFDTHREMIYKLKNMKNDADKLARKELERVGKCFYLEDYKGKFNTNLKIVIGALIGEDNVGKELLRQEKEQKDYFKTIKNIRNFNGLYHKKYI